MSARRRNAWAIAAGLVITIVALAASGESEPPDTRNAQPSALAATTLLLDAVRAGERIVAVGHFGHVLLSDDGGRQWRQAGSVPTRATLTELFFVDAQHGWAVGHDAVILHTQDGGETWSLQHRDASLEIPLLTVWFADARRGLAAGAFGTLLETRDGGLQWERRSISDDPDDELHLNHLFAGPDGTIFIAAEAGSVFRSHDDGRSWDHVDPPYRGSFWSGLQLPGGALLVMGMRGHAYRSDSLGESWELVETGSDQSISDLARFSDGSIVAVGMGGSVLHSSDDGRSFEATTEPDRKSFASLAEGADGRVLLLGETGVRTQGEAGSAE